jgi:hypothetical protein
MLELELLDIDMFIVLRRPRRQDGVQLHKGVLRWKAQADGARRRTHDPHRFLAPV